MSIFDEPKVDCHNHVFDPARFAYADEDWLPDPAVRRRVMWETPRRLFGFGG